jgi:hypothetical protein
LKSLNQFLTNKNLDSSKTKGVYEENVYTPEQKYHILRYLINFLDSKQGEIAKEIS